MAIDTEDARRDALVERLKLPEALRKTAYRWRAENGGIPPARLAESARDGRYLSLLERQRIATLRGLGNVSRRSPHRTRCALNPQKR